MPDARADQFPRYDFPVEKLLVRKTTGERADDLEKLIAISHVKRAAAEGVTLAKLGEMREKIERDIVKFKALLGGSPAKRTSVNSPAPAGRPDSAARAAVVDA